MKKKNLNIIFIILGSLFIITSLIIGYSNQFNGSKGMVFLLIGTPLLFIGISFTPRLWERLLYLLDIVVMFFSKSN